MTTSAVQNSAYTPLETFLLFDNISSLGVRSSSFQSISQILLKNPYVCNGETFDSRRLAPDALYEHYVSKIKEAEGDEERADKTNNISDENNSRANPLSIRSKWKDNTPPADILLTVNKMTANLLGLYQRSMISQIRDDEKKYLQIKRELKEIHAGLWDERLKQDHSAKPHPLENIPSSAFNQIQQELPRPVTEIPTSNVTSASTIVLVGDRQSVQTTSTTAQLSPPQQSQPVHPAAVEDTAAKNLSIEDPPADSSQISSISAKSSPDISHQDAHSVTEVEGNMKDFNETLHHQAQQDAGEETKAMKFSAQLQPPATRLPPIQLPDIAAQDNHLSPGQLPYSLSASTNEKMHDLKHQAGLTAIERPPTAPESPRQPQTGLDPPRTPVIPSLHWQQQQSPQPQDPFQTPRALQTVPPSTLEPQSPPQVGLPRILSASTYPAHNIDHGAQVLAQSSTQQLPIVPETIQSGMDPLLQLANLANNQWHSRQATRPVQGSLTMLPTPQPSQFSTSPMNFPPMHSSTPGPLYAQGSPQPLPTQHLPVGTSYGYHTQNSPPGVSQRLTHRFSPHGQFPVYPYPHPPPPQIIHTPIPHPHSLPPIQGNAASRSQSSIRGSPRPPPISTGSTTSLPSISQLNGSGSPKRPDPGEISPISAPSSPSGHQSSSKLSTITETRGKKRSFDTSNTPNVTIVENDQQPAVENDMDISPIPSVAKKARPADDSRERTDSSPSTPTPATPVAPVSTLAGGKSKRSKVRGGRRTNRGEVARITPTESQATDNDMAKSDEAEASTPSRRLSLQRGDEVKAVTQEPSLELNEDVEPPKTSIHTRKRRRSRSATESDIGDNPLLSPFRNKADLVVDTPAPMPFTQSETQSSSTTRNIASPAPTSSMTVPIGHQPMVVATKKFAHLTAPLLGNIFSHKFANLFSAPVPERLAPGYKNLIHTPQDLKSIKGAVKAGAAAVAALASTATASTAGTPTHDSPALLHALSTTSTSTSITTPATNLNTPPKGIVNSLQLEKELFRMFANAVMYNKSNSEIVRETLVMAKDVQSMVDNFRTAEEAGARKALAATVGRRLQREEETSEPLKRSGRGASAAGGVGGDENREKEENVTDKGKERIEAKDDEEASVADGMSVADDNDENGTVAINEGLKKRARKTWKKKAVSSADSTERN